jgi:hypothetical protein
MLMEGGKDWAVFFCKKKKGESSDLFGHRQHAITTKLTLWAIVQQPSPCCFFSPLSLSLSLSL